MTSSGYSQLPDSPGSVRRVVVPQRRPGRYVPHVIIVVVVVLATIVGPPGQVEAALFALAAILPLLGFRAELT
jgi:hypothetical protein